MSPLDAAGRAEVERVFSLDAPQRLRRLSEALEGLARGEDASAAARFEAHALRGGAAMAGRADLDRLCRSIEDLLGEADPDPAELAAAARLTRRAEGTLRPAGRARKALRRLVPHRFMGQLALVLALTIVPAFGISVYDTYHGRQTARTRIAEQATADAQLGAEAEQQVIDGGRRLLRALATSSEVLSGTPRSCSSLFARYAESFMPYSRFGITSATGRLVCASAPAPPGYSASRLPVFRAIASTGLFVVGALQRDPFGGPPIVVIGEPLGTNSIGGSQIGAAISTVGIQHVIDSVVLPPGSSITVVDRHGFVLARRPNAAKYVGKNVGAATITALDPGGGTNETHGIDGVRRIFAYHAAGPWYVSVGIPSAPAYATLTRELLYELLLVTGLGGLGLAIGLAGAHRGLARPLATLVTTARRIGDGDLSARTGIRPRSGEIGELASSMDGMAAALEERTSAHERAVTDLSLLAGDLESRVHERTSALEAARDEADRASRIKTAFLARLSHELRTPLNAIRGFSQLLSGGDLDPEESEAASHIAAGAEHMTRLVEELLDTARIEAGEFKVELEPLALGPIMKEAVELSRGLAADHDVTLVMQEPDAEIGVLADRGRLRQSLLNLITNGILYNRRGGSVTVRASTRGGRGVVDVLDTGDGIAEGDLERIFSPYERLGRGPDSGGLGLGLALSERLVEAMGGTIEATSEVGVGTRFTIELGEAAIPRGVTDAARPSRPAAAATTRRVLYIEDNATSMKLVELLLRGRGVAFEGASTAAAGIAAARADRPDLILLDLQLPDASGEDVLRTLRAEPALRAVPIIMLSAQASRDTVRRLLEAGADDYLTKPIEVDRAADVIERHLRRRDT
jgi:signal transduction histidine kinase/CheY-like chemotaxis protein/HPt (histidine-containing phosphotransfer) domain-containing protein